jgi:6-phosphogluconolactonase
MMPAPAREVVRARSAEALADVAASRFATAAQSAIAARGRFRTALAGGQTPRAMYHRLAAAWDRRVAWEHVDVYFGDERCVPPESPESNYRMAAEALLDPARVPPERVHRIRGELPPPEAAAAYDRELRDALGDVAGKDTPTFDVALLGVGPDGHTASLFPGSPALGVSERWAVAVPPPTAVEPRVPRVTLTLPAFFRAREVWVLCGGAGKRRVATAILDGEPEAGDWPAALVRGAERTVWLVDADAYPERA